MGQRRARASIAPEQLLRASPLQTLFTIRSQRQLVQHIEYNLPNRWVIGMTIEEPIWNHLAFSANRDRLFSEAMTQRFCRHDDRSLGLDQEFCRERRQQLAA